MRIQGEMALTVNYESFFPLIALTVHYNVFLNLFLVLNVE